MLDNLSLFSARWWCLYLAFGCIMLSNCNLERSNSLQNTAKFNTSLILDVYRGSLDHGLSLIYLAEQYYIIVKPIGQQSLDFSKTPPPPPNIDFQERKSVTIEPELLLLNKTQVLNIENLLNKFEETDFETVNNPLKTEDGLAIKVIFTNSDNLTRSFSIINGATDNQGDLLKSISDLVIQKTKLNQEQLTFFLR